MCLAIPMQITNINGFNARCAAKGVERDVSLFLLQGEMLQEGDYVLIHVGYAIQPRAHPETHGHGVAGLNQSLSRGLESTIGSI